ncbi:MAG: sugar fermentation stimulation protein A [Parasphingorhabdus sp.]|jgi:sugar fermentation stimulation protein A
MKLENLSSGRILKRYKRFFADVELETGEIVIAHCPNTGSMKGCWEPGAPCQITFHDNPKRKLKWTLERVDMGQGWVGVNTNAVNGIIAEGIENQRIAALNGYAKLSREPAFNIEGHPKSRFDIKLEANGGEIAYVEIKNTTLYDGGLLKFPDAVTERGRKHLDLLKIAVEMGHDAYILFAANRPEATQFEPAKEIDPTYSERLFEVMMAGVKVIVARVQHLPDSIEVTGGVLWEPGVTLP